MCIRDSIHMTIEPSYVTHIGSKPLHRYKLEDPLMVGTESNDTGYTSGASPGRCVVEDKTATPEYKNSN